MAKSKGRARAAFSHKTREGSGAGVDLGRRQARSRCNSTFSGSSHRLESLSGVSDEGGVAVSNTAAAPAVVWSMALPPLPLVPTES